MKKTIKIVFWFLISVIVIFNLTIIFTGRYYIYKGMSATYFKGYVQPSIYDKDIFKNRVISADTANKWFIHPKLKDNNISKKQYEYIEQLNPASFLITWGDTIIYEKYWDKHNIKKLGNSFSMAKSVVALLVGAAIEDGYIKSVNEPVANYLNAFKKEGYNKIKIRDILTMSSGLSWSESYYNPFCDVAELYYDTDAKDLVLNRRKIENEPGKIYNYKSGDTQTLVYILKKATNKTLSEYASEKIWSKIGAESDAMWSLVDDSLSEEKSFCCIYATTRDFARLGKLVNQNGKWNDEQLINEQYVKEFKSIAPLTKTNGKPNNLYGFQYRIYNGLPYEINYFYGMGGQYIICIPKYQLVIVRTGNGKGAKWKNTANKTDNALEDHRVDVPAYVSTAMTLLSLVKNK